MPFIRFLCDHTVKAAGGATYKKDDVVECSADRAGYFTRRFLAVLCPAPQAIAESVEPVEPKVARKTKVVKDVPADDKPD